jgi:hypothetical protein
MSDKDFITDWLRWLRYAANDLVSARHLPASLRGFISEAD